MSAINWLALEPYREMMGDDFVQDILQTYLSNSHSLVMQIHTAFGAQDAETFTRAAHTLKSNSAMLGAQTLADLCLQLETAGKQKQLQGLQPSLASLNLEHGQVCLEIQAKLQGE
jgi:HPt (histidine-containing phosphotransfer) domain-containing protein